MKEHLEEIIADIEHLERQARSDGDIRLLREAQTRLLLIWEAHKDDPPATRRGRLAAAEQK